MNQSVLGRIGDAHDADDSQALQELLPLVPRTSWGSLIVSAVQAGALHCVRAYVAAGVDPTEQYEGGTLISYATGRKSPEMVRTLLELGTPLTGVILVAAAHSGSVPMVKLLLEEGVDPDQGNPGFPTALGTARAFGHHEMEQLLLKHGATIEVAPSDR